MSANVASFKDYKPAYLKRRITQADATPRTESIISDMADGNLVTEFFFSFAGFDYSESHLILTLIGIMGDSQDSIELYDKEVAKIAGCDERTVQRWRKAYMEKAQKKNFWPMGIEQGAYVSGEKRYLPTKYRITFAEPLEQAVAHARASAEYRSDRLQAIEKAARRFYDDIPQAPPSLRKGKRTQSIQTPLSHLNGAAKKLTSAKVTLQDMPEQQRRAFVNGQGDELREAMENLRRQMAELEAALSDEKLSVANKEDGSYTDILSGTPQDDEGVPAYVVPKEEEGTTLPEPERKPTPEENAIWDRAFACLNQPSVTLANVEITASTPAAPPPLELKYLPDAPGPALTEIDDDELCERVAILIEDGGLSHEEAARRARAELQEQWE
jgi:hypothetical protein